MTLPLLLLLGSGLCTALCGVVFSRAAKDEIDGAAVLLVSSFLAAAAGLACFPDYGNLGKVSIWLVAAVFVAGLLCAGGLLLVTMAMREGHHGLAWTVSQSCLLWPPLVCAAWFGETLGLAGATGLLAMLGGIACVGLGKGVGEPPTNRFWLLQALAAFVLFGVQQTLLTLPSRVEALRDVCHLRVPVLQTACALVYASVWLARGRPSLRRALPLGMALGGCVVANFWLLFLGLDGLGVLGLAGIGYPVMVGSCVVLFGLYSAVVLRERLAPLQALGTTTIIFGLTLLAWPHGK